MMTMTVALALSDTLPGAAIVPAALARLVRAGKVYGTGEHAVTALADATIEIKPGEVTKLDFALGK